MDKIIKVITNENKHNNIKCILTQNEDFYIDTSFMNILRKYIISNVHTFSFVYINRQVDNPKITVENNNSSLNDDMLSHRVSLLPINILGLLYLVSTDDDLSNNNIETLIEEKKTLIEKLNFEIKVNFKEHRDYITEEHITINNSNNLNDEIKNEKLISHLKLLLNDTNNEYKTIREIIFTPYKNNYNIITKLKSDEQFNMNMNLTFNSVKTDKENNIQFSPVCATRTYCKLDYNKIIDICPNEKDLGDFIIEEGERYHTGVLNQNERIHILEYETIGFCSPLYVLKQSLKELINENIDNNLYHNLSILNNLDNNVKNEFINITDSLKVDKAIDIEIINGDDGIGYLLQTYLSYYDKKIDNKITYIGYKKIHPLINKILITIQFSDGFNQIYFKSLCEKTHTELYNIIINILNSLNQL